MKELAGVGFAATSALYLTPDDVRAASDDEVPIVVGFETDPDDPTEKIPHTKHVPVDWYDDYRRADEVFERRRRGLMNVPGVRAVWLVPGKYGGHNARIRVHVDAEHADTATDRVPEAVDGVPVETGEVGGYELGTCPTGNFNSGHYPDHVPASVQICNGDVTATHTGRVYDTDAGQEYFVISNHVYGGSGTDHEGEALYQPDAGHSAMGKVDYGYCGLDAMQIRPVNGHDPIAEVEDATPSENLTGWFTKSGLGDLAADDEAVKKYGCTTGHTQGQIESGDGWTSFYGCAKTGQLEWGDSADFDDGDSGSLVYHEPPDGSGGYQQDRIWACGMANARTADWASAVANFVWGSAAWKLHNQLNWNF